MQKSPLHNLIKIAAAADGTEIAGSNIRELPHSAKAFLSKIDKNEAPYHPLTHEVIKRAVYYNPNLAAESFNLFRNAPNITRDNDNKKAPELFNSSLEVIKGYLRKDVEDGQELDQALKVIGQFKTTSIDAISSVFAMTLYARTASVYEKGFLFLAPRQDESVLKFLSLAGTVSQSSEVAVGALYYFILTWRGASYEHIDSLTESTHSNEVKGAAIDLRQMLERKSSINVGENENANNQKLFLTTLHNPKNNSYPMFSFSKYLDEQLNSKNFGSELFSGLLLYTLSAWAIYSGKLPVSCSLAAQYILFRDKDKKEKSWIAKYPSQDISLWRESFPKLDEYVQDFLVYISERDPAGRQQYDIMKKLYANDNLPPNLNPNLRPGGGGKKNDRFSPRTNYERPKVASAVAGKAD